MIQTDQELRATQERIAYFEGLVAQFRVTTSPQEFKLMAGGFLDDIDQMHAEVIEYLGHHATEDEDLLDRSARVAQQTGLEKLTRLRSFVAGAETRPNQVHQ